MQIDLNDAVTGLNVEVMDADGKPVVTYTPDGNGTYTVANPLEADPNELTVVRSLTSTNGVKHAAAHRPHGKSCADTLTTSTTDTPNCSAAPGAR